MMIGEYHHNIDEKGRLIIPSKFRIELGEKFIITIDMEKGLFVYPMKDWNNMINELNKLSFTKKDYRTFMRMLLSGATECELDKSGRVNIANPLKNYASLEKECVIIGVNDRLEIWSENGFEDFFNSNIENYSDIAENLFETTC